MRVPAGSLATPQVYPHVSPGRLRSVSQGARPRARRSGAAPGRAPAAGAAALAGRASLRFLRALLGA